MSAEVRALKPCTAISHCSHGCGEFIQVILYRWKDNVLSMAPSLEALSSYAFLSHLPLVERPGNNCHGKRDTGRRSGSVMHYLQEALETPLLAFLI